MILGITPILTGQASGASFLNILELLSFSFFKAQFKVAACRLAEHYKP